MTDQNFFPWDDIPDDNVLPEGTLHMRIDSLEDGMSGTGKRMFRAQFSVVAPIEFAGQKHFENFVTGSEENPTAILPGTVGSRMLKKCLSAAQVPANNDIVALCNAATGAELLMNMVIFEEPDGQYKGQKRNRVSGWLRLGDREVGLAPKQGAPGQGVAPPTASAPSPPTAPVQPQAAPAAPQQPAAPAAPAAPAPAPAQPVEAPPTQVPPTPQNGPMLKCTICQADVPVAEFGAHMQQHVQG